MSHPPSIPHLRKQGRATQLIVDGAPYLIIGGELHNSSASNLAYMTPIWARLKALHLNTVLAVVAWEQLEPTEGAFDFALVDGLIQAARRHDLRLILLWFGTWKNGMSSYAPGWVKRDVHRFPRVRVEGGRAVEILSTFGTQTREADARAFAALMGHLREVDSEEQTVIMVQVQNEVGVLGDARDRSPLAEAAFAAPVPTALLDYLQQHKADLGAGLLARWATSGFQTDGNWEAIFGSGPLTDELFMAWHYARYVEAVAAAGNAAYPLPLFANAWLSTLGDAPGGWASGGQKPGEWPSGGPLPQTLDIWLAGAPHLDFFAPDIYQPEFAAWCRQYVRRDNPLFIPEMHGNETGARQLFYALGEHDAMGVSPFGIDAQVPGDENPLQRSYAVLRQLAPLILAHQGHGEMIGFLLHAETPTVVRTLGGYELEITLDEGFGQAAQHAGGLIMAEGPDQFLGAGFGFRVRFRGLPPGLPSAGIEAVDEGTFVDGRWVAGRRLNGDETGRGNWWRFLDFTAADGRAFTNELATGISKCTVYRYE